MITFGMRLNRIRNLFRRRKFYSSTTALPTHPDGKWISYAGELEDVYLNRCFSKPGFYIDVGACHPVEGSITKHFYDAGWNGINVEPVNANFRLLTAERTRDINLGVAAGEADGEVSFFSMWSSGNSTMKQEIADRFRASSMPMTETRVVVRSLNSICIEHNPPTIDFLKIDVEGAELEVLKGIDLERFRPRVLIVEATEPNSPKATHECWEPLVLVAGYQFAHFDGVNRWYVPNECTDLLRHFRLPPNVWDGFIRYAEWRDQCELCRIFR